MVFANVSNVVQKMDELNKKDRPLISVVMAVYKEPLEYIQKATESILNQTYRNLELVVVLDNPKNISALDYLTQCSQDDKRLTLMVNNKNIGLALSLNRGIESSNGDFIARMDADDISKKDRLEKQISYLIQHPEIGILGGDVEKIDKDGKALGLMRAPDLEKFPANKIIKYRTVAFHPTWMLKKTLYEEMNYYNPLLVAQDYDFLYRCVLKGKRIRNLNVILLDYRISGENLSVEKSLIQLKSKFFVQSFYKKQSLFSESAYKRFIESNSLISKLHKYSTVLFIAAMGEKTIFGKYIKLFLSSLISPYQLRHVASQIMYKIICR